MKIEFENIKDEIIKKIKMSKKEILLMLAWFTEKEIFKSLEEKVNEGVQVKLILSNSEWNIILLERFKALSMASDNFKVKTYGSISPDINPFLHTKLCIIDGEYLMDGSYNWTKNAGRNKESYSFIDEKEIVEKCIVEFHKIWAQSDSFDFTQQIDKQKQSEYIQLEEKGITPEKFIELEKEKPATTIPETNPLTAQVAVEEQNLSKNGDAEQNKLLVDTVFKNARRNKEINESLVLYGVEISRENDNTLYISFAGVNALHKLAVDRNEIRGSLELDRDIYLLKSVFGDRIPLHLININPNSIIIHPPINIASYSRYLKAYGFTFEITPAFRSIARQYIDGIASTDDFIKKYPNISWLY